MKTLMLGAFAALLATTAAVSGVAAKDYNREVVIINESSFDIREFYATNTDDKTWGWDFLGSKILPAGYNVAVNIDDDSGYCLYDFRAIFVDGVEVVTENVNVCEVADFTYYD